MRKWVLPVGRVAWVRFKPTPHQLSHKHPGVQSFFQGNPVVSYDRTTEIIHTMRFLIGKKNKKKRWKPYRRLSKCDNNRAPFFRLSVQRLSISLGFEYSWAFVQLVIPMTEHQLQMPVSLADPLAADESYFSSTDWDAVLQIKKKLKKNRLGKSRECLNSRTI